MGFKQRLQATPVVGTALAVQERYKVDGADPLAAAIGYFAFLSLFPLILLAVSVAGFLLDDPADQVAVADAITSAIPGFDATMQQGDEATEVSTLVEGAVEQRGTIGGIGAVLLLLSGLRVVNAAMISTRVVFRGEVQSGVMAKLRQLAALVGLGLLALLGVAGSSLAGVGIGALPNALNVLLSLAITFGLDLLLFLGAYKLLSPTSSLTVRQLVPGAVLGALGWTVLKVAGASYVGRQVDSASALYGALGGIIALLLLLYLAGRLYLYGAELTAVQVEREHGPLPLGGSDSGSASEASTGQRSDASTTPEDPPMRDRSRAPHDSADVDGPPAPPRLAFAPRPVDPGPSGPAPTIGADTREQLAAADQRHRSERDERDPGAEARHAIALGLGVAALAAGYRWLRSDLQ